jgi:hypothetical protein
MIEPRRHKDRKKHKEERKEDCSASLAIRQHGGFLAIDRYR